VNDRLAFWRVLLGMARLLEIISPGYDETFPTNFASYE
jgi:hypothetical protein